ncbi:MAG: DegT/DnrJ/EryC1/StrS family aminotransferase [Myxococcales bacterium]|jgi:dTDP-4-amino-4,6-dideoxygalactose transaminase
MSDPESIPLLDLSAQHEPLMPELQAAMARVVASNHFIMGPEVSGFEQEVADYLGAQHAIGVSSGTDALLVSLMALGIGDGDEVVTSPFTFFATAGCVARLGARPVFVDIDPDTYNLDVSRVEDAITERTRAVVPVHLFGQMADLPPLQALCGQRSVPIIEDAAQAIGASSGGRKAGTVGDFGCYSFFPAKNLGCFGDGGLVTTNDDAMAERVRILRVHGSKPKYHHRLIGGNFRLDAIQAAVLRVKLPHLDGWAAARAENAARYDLWFAEAGLPAERLRTPVKRQDGHVYNQYVIETDDRDGLRAHLTERGIGTEIYYPTPLHLQPCFEYLGHGPGSFPLAERAAGRVLALPIFGELGEQRQRRVADAVLEYLRAG